MEFQLILNRDQIDRCRRGAREIAHHLHRYIDRHTSEGVERGTLRALGVVGTHKGRPLTEWAIEKIGRERLREGAAYWLGYVMVERTCDANKAAMSLARHGLPEKKPARLPHGEIRRVTRQAARDFQHAVAWAVKHRKGGGTRRARANQVPFAYLLASGHPAQDLKQLKVMDRKTMFGATLRPPVAATGVSLQGRSQGWRGARFDLLQCVEEAGAMAQATSEADHPSFPVTWAGWNLLAPEIGVAVATSGMHAVEYDCLTQSRLGGVHFNRAIVDQQFLYRLLAKSGQGVVVASDRWRSLVDGYSHGHELLMGQLLIEAMGGVAGLTHEAVQQRHGLIMHGEQKDREDRLCNEIAHAQLVREMFPQVPVSMMLADDDVESSLVGMGIAALCGFNRCDLLHAGSEKNAAAQRAGIERGVTQLREMLGSLSSEVGFLPNGKISRRTLMLVERVTKMMEHHEQRDFLKLTSGERHGLFAIPNTGAGIEGVIQRHKYYWNPVMDWLAKG